MSNTLTLYPLANYMFGTKEAQLEEDSSVAARLERLQSDYQRTGMRRTVEGVLVVHEHNHPHILMLQIANAFFKLPGDYLRPGEDEEDGMKNRLAHKLSPNVNAIPPIESAAKSDWEVGDVLSVWWRPNFETFMYPYIPPHITKPKEMKKIFVIPLPEKMVLSVPKNMKLLAVPLFELYDNSTRYGPQLAALPHLLSKYNLVFQD